MDSQFLQDMDKIAFTLVLNGMPFIKTQAEIIPCIFDKWYIIEGVSLPVNDTNWCQVIPSKYYNSNYLSIDGTTEFIDSLQAQYPDKVHIIRKNTPWQGKVEMCNSFIDNISNCVLMEFDVDEIWNKNTLTDVLQYAINMNNCDGMLFDCDFFVGNDIILSKCGGYADSSYEWLRLWKINKKTKWISHEPPRLQGLKYFKSKQFTKSKSWTFKHYAYTTREQLQFKEDFYGYKNAYNSWLQLQHIDTQNFPLLARDYLPWIKDNTKLIKIDIEN